MTRRRPCLAAVLMCLLPYPALAQPEPEPASPTGDEPEPADTGEGAISEDEPITFEESTDPGDETPGDPETSFTEKADDDKAAVKTVASVAQTGYPSEEIYRPLTLPGGMSEVSLEIPVDADPFVTSGLLRGRYGVTREAQVGLRYGLGSMHEDGFSTGKTLSLDGHYQLTSWVAAQLSLPILLDPFSMGITLGAPFKFEFFDKFALAGGADLLSFKVHRFVPEVDNALANEAYVALDDINEILPDGEIRLIGQFIYQLSKKTAFDGRFGLRAIDFSTADAPVLLDVGLTKEIKEKIDIGARAGFSRLDDAPESFRLSLFAALRI